mmetsp:Transcript_62216/g.196902  ORF Transcript_62216/g.196902 Transcript_62216/m.196902 type:complete len:203 (-) Transcript_62216:304-912(-)
MSPRTPCGACCRPSVCHHRVGGSLFLTPPRGGKQREDYNISNLKMAIGLGKWKARMKSNMDKPAAPATGKYGPSSDDRIKSMASSKRATRHEVPSVYAAVWERDINRTPRRDTTKDLKVINKHYLQKTPLPRTAQITSMDAWFNEYGEPKGVWGDAPSPAVPSPCSLPITLAKDRKRHRRRLAQLAERARSLVATARGRFRV